MPQQPEDRERTGLIGIGLLGSALSDRLLTAGHAVIGFDADPIQMKQLEASGGICAASAAEIFEQTKLIILCLPDSTVTGQLLGACQSSLRSVHTIIDTTTGTPDEMASFARQLANSRVNYIEANVAASSAMLRDGDATFFVGANQPLDESVRKTLNAIAPRVFEIGRVGDASRLKLVHNLILGLNRAALAEGLVLAESFGLDLSRVVDVLQHTPAASGALTSKGAKMVEADYSPQARLSQHLKDVRLILEEFRKVGNGGPLSTLHEQLLESAVQLGYGASDNSAIVEAVRSSIQGSD